MSKLIFSIPNKSLQYQVKLSAKRSIRFISFSVRTVVQPNPFLFFDPVATFQNSIKFCGITQTLSPLAKSVPTNALHLRSSHEQVRHFAKEYLYQPNKLAILVVLVNYFAAVVNNYRYIKTVTVCPFFPIPSLFFAASLVPEIRVFQSFAKETPQNPVAGQFENS